MGIEIERKFLVHASQWGQLPKPAGTKFKQGYIVDDVDKTIRIRITDKQAYLTFKGRSEGVSRSEYEYIIPLNDGLEMLQKFAKSLVEKTRYCIDYENKTWEVDVFSGNNEGLIVAEIELESEDEQFALPPWVGREVTDDERYYNANLSTRPYKMW